MRAERESEFMAAVIDWARLNDWLIYHTHDSRRSAKGFPDLTLVRERLLFAELKTERGRIAPAQRSWLDALAAAGCEVHLWRPRDWNEIVLALTRRDAA